SGAITAQGELGLKVGGDLVVETVVDGQLVGRQASVSGGTVNMDVAGDVRFAGASLKAKDGLSVQAGGDIALAAVAQTTQASGGGRTTQEVESLTNQLQAGGDVTLRSGGTLHSEGTSFQAGGDMRLSAEKDIALVAVAETSQSSGWGQTTKEVDHLTNQLQAGGNRSLEALSNQARPVGVVVRVAAGEGEGAEAIAAATNNNLIGTCTAGGPRTG
ncbi:hemagglutinin repeat-containing protein, partial [Leptospira sp. 96542]|nr:hemagglutinin repeat-containing protein [Leptospira sp. 96542]